MLPRVAAVTMAYNEPDFAPLWAAHYAAELGAANCFVVDHGSDDGSLAALGGVNVLRIPRSPQDDVRRARFVSGFCASLLTWYDAVLHTDVDEMLVADPAHHASLATYCAADTRPVVSAIGLDVVHVPEIERPLARALPVTRQRRWLRFSSAMCKPVLIRAPVEWAPGFHSVDADPVWGGLYLFHLRYADLGRGLLRLAKTRAQPWQEEAAGAHQRMADGAWEAMLRSMAGLERRDAGALLPDEAPLAPWLERVRASAAGRAGETYRIDLHISGDELWRLPRRFVDRF
jgi:hypothetical protein